MINFTQRILNLLQAHNIDGHDKPGGTDKNTNHSYVEIYGEILSPFISKKGCLLEIGIQYGGSSLLWQELLPNFKLCFIDNEDKVDPSIKKRLIEGTSELLFTDGYSKDTLNFLKTKYPQGFDIIIDDGPHTIESQRTCIENYLNLLNPGGIMVIEDIQDFSYVDQLRSIIPNNFQIDCYDHRDKKIDTMMLF